MTKDELTIENNTLRQQLEVYKASEKILSDAYLHIQELLNAYDTSYGGEDRFEVTEKKLKILIQRVRDLEIQIKEAEYLQMEEAKYGKAENNEV